MASLGPPEMTNSKEKRTERDKINDQFFKVILEPKDMQLRIPPVFARKLSAMHHSNHGLLHNIRTNESWKVNIERKKNKMSFTKGWCEFVAHHRLMKGDFVTFEHIGEMQFNVRIFGKTACEKPLLPIPSSVDSHHSVKQRQIIQHNTNSPPSFTKKMTPLYFNHYPRVQIPLGFAEKHGLFEMPRNAILIDAHSNHHIVMVTCSKEGLQRRIRLGSGITSFFNMNNIEVGDHCIFELDLIAKQSNQLLFNVFVKKHEK